jgi:hypothetical protein
MSIQKRDNKVTNDERIAVLENTCSHMLTSLARIETNLSLLQNRIESRFSLTDSKIDEGLKNINNRIWTLFFWKAAALAAVLSVMAHGFKWI